MIEIEKQAGDNHHIIALIDQLLELGIMPKDRLMVHLSAAAERAIGGGVPSLIEALLSAVGPLGTIMAPLPWRFLSGRSPLDRTGPFHAPGREALDDCSDTLAVFLQRRAGARRSEHPYGGVVAIGNDAAWHADPPAQASAFGPGSPTERFLACEGKILSIGAPPGSLVAAQYAWAVARIKGKRRLSYSALLGDGAQRKWATVSHWDRDAVAGEPDGGESGGGVAQIVQAYLDRFTVAESRLGDAPAILLDARQLVGFAISWLEARHGEAGGALPPLRCA